MANSSGDRATVSGVYVSSCHYKERTILQGHIFPHCSLCDKPTTWIYDRPTVSAKSATASKRSQ